MVFRRFDDIPMAIDTDQEPSMAKETIIVMSRANILHVMVLIIDRRLESMFDRPPSI
jgi:hypothetical protein